MRFLILSVALLLAPAGAFAGNGTDLLAAQRMAHRLLAERIAAHARIEPHDPLHCRPWRHRGERAGDARRGVAERGRIDLSGTRVLLERLARGVRVARGET